MSELQFVERIDAKSYWLRRLEEAEARKRILMRFLSERSVDALVELVNAMWNFNVYKNKRWFVENRVISKLSVEQVAERINKLLELGDPDAVEIPGFGLYAKTELLFMYDPERFPLMNRRVLEVLEGLGYEVRTYEEFKRALDSILSEKLLNEKKRLEERLGVHIPKYDFVDGILYLANRGDEGADTGITTERLRAFLACEVPTLIEQSFVVEIPSSLMDKLRRVAALEEAVFGRRPSIVELIEHALDLYRKELIKKLSSEG